MSEFMSEALRTGGPSALVLLVLLLALWRLGAWAAKELIPAAKAFFSGLRGDVAAVRDELREHRELDTQHHGETREMVGALREDLAAIKGFIASQRGDDFDDVTPINNGRRPRR